jgi:hypothetical protein
VRGFQHLSMLEEGQMPILQHTSGASSQPDMNKIRSIIVFGVQKVEAARTDSNGLTTVASASTLSLHAFSESGFGSQEGILRRML